jgi:hypothetical protein
MDLFLVGENYMGTPERVAMYENWATRRVGVRGARTF